MQRPTGKQARGRRRAALVLKRTALQTKPYLTLFTLERGLRLRIATTPLLKPYTPVLSSGFSSLREGKNRGRILRRPTRGFLLTLPYERLMFKLIFQIYIYERLMFKNKNI